MPKEPELNAGSELAMYLTRKLEEEGVSAGEYQEIEFGVAFRCVVGGRDFEILVTFDFVNFLWWEVSIVPDLSWVERHLTFFRVDLRPQSKLVSLLDNILRRTTGLIDLEWNVGNKFLSYDYIYSKNPLLLPEYESISWS